MSKFQNDAIFWVDVDKIDPNPYQPRRDFNEEGLRDLAESIRQYGVLQPLTVTRNEETKDDGGLKVYYELIAGERRLRAAKMANLSQVPVTIRDEKEDAEVKLELAIIENLQREDLNPVERAEAFNQLSEEFDFTHKEIAEKIGKSREYVSNSMRLLKLPEEIKQAVIAGKITEGHARPIMMLRDKPEKQHQLFKEVVRKDLTVRETEERARRDAQDKVRKKKNKIDPETKALEEELSDTLGTRVTIEKDKEGGKLVIDFFSDEDLEGLIEMVKNNEGASMDDVMKEYADALNEQKEEKGKAENSDEASEQGLGKESEQDGAVDGGQEGVGDQPQQDSDGSKEVAANGEQGNQQSEGMAETLGSMIQQARAEQNDADNGGGQSEEGPAQITDSKKGGVVTQSSQNNDKAEKELAEVSGDESSKSDQMSQKGVGTSDGVDSGGTDSIPNIDSDGNSETASTISSNTDNQTDTSKGTQREVVSNKGSQSQDKQQDDLKDTGEESVSMKSQNSQDSNTSQSAGEMGGQSQSKENKQATNNRSDEKATTSEGAATDAESNQRTGETGNSAAKMQSEEAEANESDHESVSEVKENTSDDEQETASNDPAGSQNTDTSDDSTVSNSSEQDTHSESKGDDSDEDDMYSVSNFSV